MEEWVIKKKLEHWMDLERVEAGSVWREASVKWDGCIHYTRHYNTPGGDGESDYLHICDLDGFIKSLEELKEIATAHFGEDWGE